MPNDITFVIFTYNEEARIERVIKNFKDYGKILLADDGSTDRTQEIAKAYGCDVLRRPKPYAYVENQEMVDVIYENTTTTWIYWGFADEMLEKPTLEKIQKIITDDKHDIINIDRKNYFQGKFCYNLYHARTNKIFKKKAIDFTDNEIHGMGKPTVAAHRIYKMPDKYFVHHFISNTVASYVNTLNSYSTTELEFAYTANTSVWFFIVYVIKSVLKDFFYAKGYKAGFSGLTLVELMLYYSLLKNMKHYEKSQSLNKEVIESRNNVFKDEIIKALHQEKVY